MSAPIKRFDAYEVHGIREFEESGLKFCEQVPDEEAEFWSLFGYATGEGLACIGDFNSREEAADSCDRITGLLLGSGPDELPRRRRERMAA